MNKQNKNEHIVTENRLVVTIVERGHKKGKRDQLYGDGWKQDFWW